MNFPPGAIPGMPLTQPGARLPKMPQMPLQSVQQLPSFDETFTPDIDSSKEEESEIDPPDDWLQPKVFKGSVNQPESFSENKG